MYQRKASPQNIRISISKNYLNQNTIAGNNPRRTEALAQVPAFKMKTPSQKCESICKSSESSCCEGPPQQHNPVDQQRIEIIEQQIQDIKIQVQTTIINQQSEMYLTKPEIQNMISRQKSYSRDTDEPSMTRQEINKIISNLEQNINKQFQSCDTNFQAINEQIDQIPEIEIRLVQQEADNKANGIQLESKIDRCLKEQVDSLTQKLDQGDQHKSNHNIQNLVAAGLQNLDQKIKQTDDRINSLQAQIAILKQQQIQQMDVGKQEAIQILSKIEDISKLQIKPCDIEKYTKQTISNDLLDLQTKINTTVNQMLEQKMQPSISQIENIQNHRFIKIVDAYESRAESKVNAAILEFENYYKKEKQEWGQNSDQRSKSTSLSISPFKKKKKSSINSPIVSKQLVFHPEAERNRHSHCKPQPQTPKEVVSPKQDQQFFNRQNFNSSTRIKNSSKEFRKRSISPSPLSLLKDSIDPIYKQACPITTSISYRDIETGYKAGKNMHDKPPAVFFYPLKLVGKGLDIQTVSENHFAAFSLQRGQKRPALIQKMQKVQDRNILRRKWDSQQKHYNNTDIPSVLNKSLSSNYILENSRQRLSENHFSNNQQ